MHTWLCSFCTEVSLFAVPAADCSVEMLAELHEAASSFVLSLLPYVDEAVGEENVAACLAAMATAAEKAAAAASSAAYPLTDNVDAFLLRHYDLCAWLYDNREVRQESRTHGLSSR